MCNVDEKGKKDANALSIANVGGVFVVLVVGLLLSVIVVFVVLVVGLLLSVIVAVVEFVCNERKRPLAVDGSKVDWTDSIVNAVLTREIKLF